MGVRKTSREAYYSLDNLGKRQKQVLDCLQSYGYLTNCEISHHLNLPINCITPRTNEIFSKGFIQSFGTRNCSITGKRATQWGISAYHVKMNLFLKNSKNHNQNIVQENVIAPLQQELFEKI